MAYSVAQAWIVEGYGWYIDWLYVMDGHRRQGFGSALLKAITERWPDVEFDAFTESGEQFLDAIEENESLTSRGNRHDDD
ncbi:MAG: GNAT family N-acetyltransferase [Planctomycetes bacterium]|nr:GNAT family N-acetyltransferase [Planctomycetota bacterium]